MNKMIGHIVLTVSDLENILLWYHRAFHQKDDCSTSNKNTLTKLQALLIAEHENEDSLGYRVVGEVGR